MRHTLLAAVFVTLLSVTSHARAAGCASIADRDCPPPPAVTVKGDLRVEIKTRESEQVFAQPGDIEDTDLAGACANAQCVCRAFVQHLDFKGPVPGFRRVNEDEWRAAAAVTCSAENARVGREVVRFAVTKRTVSIAISDLEYCATCGGSCHGHTALKSYDAKTGAVLTLRDAIAPQKLAALRTRLAADFVAANGEGARDYSRTILNNDLARTITLDTGLYVEPGAAFVNLDSFALGCASGSFHPVRIPRRFLTRAFRVRL
jgi:hypothetical protein